MGKRALGAAAVVVAGAALVLGLAARHRPRPASSRFHAAGQLIDENPARFALPPDLAALKASQWIERYDPARAWNGYTLELYRRRTPILFDMNGNVVHAWPEVRGIARARLTSDDRLLLIGLDNVVHEYDWAGQEVWSFAPPAKDDFPHHDVRRLANGNNLLLFRDSSNGTDYILEVDHGGRVVWEWRSYAFVHQLGQSIPHAADGTHMNSLFELPANPLFDAGDRRFTPGNILVSARNLNLLFILDRKTQEVVWQHSAGLDFQHGASMIEKGTPGAGHVLVFNNGFHDRRRRSVLQEIDPATGTLVREIKPEYLFSKTDGNVQAFPNGNLLITSSNGGRFFEVDKTGAIVWQCIPPFAPMRPERYAYDFSPRLAALGRPREVAIAAKLPGPWVDRELYRLPSEDEAEVREIAGRKHEILKIKRLRRNPVCIKMIVPPTGRWRMGYGLDTTARGPVHFRVTLDAKPGDQVEVASEELTPGREPVWRDATFDLSPYAYRSGEICMHAVDKTPGASTNMPKAVLWERPAIETVADSQDGIVVKQAASPEEQRNLDEQMKAMGYVQ